MWFFVSKLIQVNEFVYNINKSDINPASVTFFFIILLTSIWEQRFYFLYQKLIKDSKW